MFASNKNPLYTIQYQKKQVGALLFPEYRSALAHTLCKLARANLSSLTVMLVTLLCEDSSPLNIL